MRGGQPEQRALQDGQRGLGPQRPVPGQQLLERDPVHRLHHQRGAVLAGDELVEPDHVRVGDPAQHQRLVPEPVDGGAVARPPAQVLDRDGGARGGVPGEHHPALRPRAQLPYLGESVDPPVLDHVRPGLGAPTGSSAATSGLIIGKIFA
jgi:hypothetical protein